MLDVEQVALLEEVLAERESSAADRARIMARLSVALTLDAEHDRRAALADEAAALARTAGDDAALVHALAAWCDAHASAADVESRLATTDEMLRAAVHAGDPELELLTRRFRIVACMERGEVERATAEIRAFARLADSLRQPVFQWYARTVEGMLALLHGDLDAAWGLGTTAAELGRRARSANAQMLAEGGVLAIVLRERGDREGFLATITAANAGHPEAARGFDFIFPLFLVGYGVERATVVEILERMPREFPWVEHDSLYLFVFSTIGNAAAFVGAVDRYEDAWERLLPHADRFVLDGTAAVCYGPVSATLGRIAHARGDTDDARRWFRRALDALARVNAPLLQDRIQRELAALGTSAADTAPRPAEIPAGAARFEREGDTWLLAFGGASTAPARLEGPARSRRARRASRRRGARPRPRRGERAARTLGTREQRRPRPRARCAGARGVRAAHPRPHRARGGSRGRQRPGASRPARRRAQPAAARAGRRARALGPGPVAVERRRAGPQGGDDAHP